jgi:hypothetical protein
LRPLLRSESRVYLLRRTMLIKGPLSMSPLPVVPIETQLPVCPLLRSGHYPTRQLPRLNRGTAVGLFLQVFYDADKGQASRVCRTSIVYSISNFLYNIVNKYFRNGGGGGSRTHVRKNFQQRAFMLFHVPLCLVIDA